MTLETDVLVIGSGAAGLTFALEASRNLRVLLVTKNEIRESNTRYAQGGIAAVLHLQDDYRQHIADTLTAGAGICDEEAVKVLVQEAPARIRDLIRWGVEFDRDPEKGLRFAREGGHSRSRILHVGDLTGKAIEEAMVQRVLKSPAIEIHEREMLVDLVVRDGHCYGALLLGPEGILKPVFSRATFLATGGAGQLFSRTTNPDIATGDGVAVCHRAGAELQGLEFFQFHPTAFARHGAPAFLISEALRGEGARLLDPRGIPFMENYHSMGDLAPRDIVSRAIYDVMFRHEADHVFLDISHRSRAELERRFPFIHQSCAAHGIEIDREPIPVSPAAHYTCGGVKTDIDGRTSISGLYASGEVAQTGVHGGNRLASNSLLESVVFAYRAAVHTDRLIHFLFKGREKGFRQLLDRGIPWNREEGVPPDAQEIGDLRQRLRDLMWRHAGVIRTDQGLHEGIGKLAPLEARVQRLLQSCSWSISLLELRNLIILGGLVLEAALAQPHSVGCHFSQDRPPLVKPPPGPV